MFCLTSSSISAEHLWPIWLLASVGANNNSRIEGLLGTQSSPCAFGGALRARCVCTGCNNGWMSSLEVAAGPILEAMIHDLSSSLSDSQQNTLARWAVKSAMVFEFTDPMKHFYYSQTERTNLSLREELPLDTHIWIGRYSGEHPLQVQKNRLGTSTRPDVLSEGSVSTFVLGRLVLQVASFRRLLHKHLSITVDENGYWEQHFSSIWPIASQLVSWPPIMSFSTPSADINTISQRFTNPARDPHTQ